MKGTDRPKTDRYTLTQLITDNGAKAIKRGKKKLQQTVLEPLDIHLGKQ